MKSARTSGLAPLILALASPFALPIGPAPALDADDLAPPALPARLDLSPGPHYVGQAIEVRVLVSAEGITPGIDPPVSPDLEIVPGARGFRPISVTGIGDLVTESNLFFQDFLAVPRRAGKIAIPPFRVRLGERSGATAPRPIEARQPPAAGRPPGFLGGVGRLDVSSRLVPAAVRLGEPARLEIRLRGPGAFGSTARPTLSGLGKVPLGLEVTPAGGDWSPQAAERAWFYTVRASRPGTGKIPPVVVSTFEPSRRGYSTYSSPSPSLRVAAPTAFRPDTIQQTPQAPPGPPPRGWLRMVILALAAGLALAGAAALVIRSARGPRAFARRMARALERTDAAEVADLGARALAGYLTRAGGWPGGELTAEEARRGVDAATGRADLADEAARFVDEIDRLRFGGPGVDAGASRAIGAGLLGKLGRAGGNPKRVSR